MSISTTLSINDKVTSAVEAMIQRIEKMDARIAKMDRTWSVADKEIRRATTDVDKFNSASSGAAKEANKVASAWGGVGTAVKGAMAYFSISSAIGFFQGSMSVASEQSRMERQLATTMANMGGDYEGFQGIKQTASALQSRTAYGDESYLGGAAELATYLADPKAIEAMLPTLADYAVGMSGGGTIDSKMMVEYATQLGKVFVGAYDGIKKKGFEVSDAQKKIIENGSDMEKVAVITDIINESWKGLAENMAKDPEAAIQQRLNVFGDMREEIGNRLYPAVLKFFDVFTKNEATASKTMNNIATAGIFLMGVITGIAEVGVLGIDILSEYGDVGIAVLGGVGLAWIYVKTQAWLAGMSSLAAMTGTTTGALMGTAAVNGLSGAFAALKAAIAATGIGLIPVIIGIIIASTMQWIHSVGGLSNAFDIVKIRAGLAFDWIVMKIDNAIARLSAFMSGSKAAMVAAEKAINNRENAFKTKAEIAETKINNIKIQGDKQPGDDPMKKIFDRMGGGNIDSVGSVGSVGKINNPVEIDKEDIKLLRDVAEAEFIQNFVTLTPEVSMSIGQVNEPTDVNTIVEVITEKVVEVIEASAEGAYS